MKTKYNIIVGILIFLMIASVGDIATAQLSHGDNGGLQNLGHTDPNAPHMPKLGPLPSGVTPAYTFDSHAYLSLRPNPIGQGQALLINVWTSPGMYHAFYMQGYQVDIRKPDGSTETIGPFISYTADATAWIEYIPDQVGTWQFKFSSAGTYIPAGEYVDRPGFDPIPAYQGGVFGGGMYQLGASVYYTPDSTGWQNLTVQSDYVSSWPSLPLPTDYWTRPANNVNRDWYSILGNYPFSTEYYYPNGHILYQSNYKQVPYVAAPNTGHVVWKRTVTGAAGMIGGVAYDYSTNSAPGTPSIIYNGRCYQSITKVASMLINGTYVNEPTTVWQCYDLRTGAIYWEQTGVTTIPNLIEYAPPATGTSVQGEAADIGFSVSLMAIANNRLVKFTPVSGAVSVNVSIPTFAATTYYQDTWALSIQTINSSSWRLINWTTRGSDTNFTNRIAPRTDSYAYQGKWNISWPKATLDTIDFEAGVSMYAWWSTPPGPQWCIGNILNATDLYTGRILWAQNYNNTASENIQGAGFVVVERGKVAFGGHGMQWACWNSRTGQKLWDSDKTEYPWGAWWPYSTATYDVNETTTYIITSTYEGVYAINLDTGHIVWHYQDPNAVPFEDPYNATPFFTAVMSADGKVYAYNGEHTPSYPFARDWKIHCINATTGEGLWKMLNPMVPGAVADGYLTASNPYDGYMYVFGRGLTATTVTASPKTVAQGSQVLIEGTVLDQSPGQPGTPCVAKNSMETQMEHIHLGMPIDGIWHNETITGVPVVLTAIGTDGSVIDLGAATTNGYYGTFSFAWTPPKQDTYTITASFASDDSYGSSSAATAVTVGPAPTLAPTASPPAAPVDYMPTLTGILAAVVIAIILSAIALVVVLRKH